MPSSSSTTVTSRGDRLRERARSVDRADLVLLVKASAATVIAWVVSDRLMGSATPYYAPLAALLVVDKTIVRSVGESARRLGAIGLGMGTAWLVGTTVGVSWWSMWLVVFVALLLGRWSHLGAQGLQVPSMALLSILTAGGTNEEFTAVTMLETLVGGLIGVSVNAVLLAPVHVQEPREQVLGLVDRGRTLLGDIADGLRQGWDVERAQRWYERAAELDDQAPPVLEEIELGRESLRLNIRDGGLDEAPEWDGYRTAVEVLRRVSWHLGGMARTLRDAAESSSSAETSGRDDVAPDQDFLDGIAAVLVEAAASGESFGREGEDALPSLQEHLDRAGAQIDELTHSLHERRLDNPLAWPVYGALLHDARRLVAEIRGQAGYAVVPGDG